MIDLNKYAQAIHENAKAKGWWDNRARSWPEIRMLAVSEIAEATECVRNGEPWCWQLREMSAFPQYESNKVKISYGDERWIAQDQIGTGGSYPKPEGEAVELVDAVIRTLDYIGYLAKAIGGSPTELESSYSKSKFTRNPLINHDMFCHILHGRNGTEYDKMIWMIRKIEEYFDFMGWNFEEILNLKMEFNRTRDYRHGGKAY